MRRVIVERRFTPFPDLLILLLLATFIYGLVAIGQESQAEYHPVTEIDLSLRALPYYTLLSAIRGFVAYGFSLVFTFVVGYAAAKSARAERFILPLLDILQSIPVLGFLPGLVLGLVAIFPGSNIGLELSAIIMIFTGQVWNMTFSFYASLKSLPMDFQEASTLIGMDWKLKLRKVELPFASIDLAWNSLFSMAGGWFFLSACEAFSLGNRDYRLPGIGSYMAVAIQQGNARAITMGVLAMTLLIVVIDFFMWRPILAWVQRFRLDEGKRSDDEEPLMQFVIRESRLLRWVKIVYRRYRPESYFRSHEEGEGTELRQAGPAFAPLTSAWAQLKQRLPHAVIGSAQRRRWIRWIESGLVAAAILLAIWFSWKLVGVLATLDRTQWVVIIRNTFWSLLRVLGAVALSTLWTVPFGIWVGTSPKRIRIAQPIIQILASFPAPMLYPLALVVFFSIGLSFDFASMLLIFMGVQWYVLFNVLAGALRIPRELADAMELIQTPVWERWKLLYLPSVFPSLVTGWVTAAGGAWNATIVAEYLNFDGKILETGGLGSTISVAASQQNFTVLAASLTVMVIVVVAFNRLVWARVYQSAQTRYRMDF